LLLCLQHVDRMSFHMRVVRCLLPVVLMSGWCLAAFVRIIHDHAGVVEAHSTPMTMICFLLGIIVVVISLFLSCLLGLYRLVGRFSSWSSQKKREPIRVNTKKSLRGIPEKAAKKTHRVRFASHTTVILVEKWLPGLGQEFLEMVARNTAEVIEERWLEQWQTLEAAAAASVNWEAAAAAAVAKTQSQLHSLCITLNESSSSEQSIEAVGDCSNNDDSVEMMDWECTPDPPASTAAAPVKPLRSRNVGSRGKSFIALLATIPESEEREEENDDFNDFQQEVSDEEQELEQGQEQEQGEETIPPQPAETFQPRRSTRIRRSPDRWVPPCGRTIQSIPLGSFFQSGGLRRSGRIAAVAFRTTLP
jgi:hypothetical protein